MIRDLAIHFLTNDYAIDDPHLMPRADLDAIIRSYSTELDFDPALAHDIATELIKLYLA